MYFAPAAVTYIFYIVDTITRLSKPPERRKVQEESGMKNEKLFVTQEAIVSCVLGWYLIKWYNSKPGDEKDSHLHKLSLSFVIVLLIKVFNEVIDQYQYYLANKEDDTVVHNVYDNSTRESVIFSGIYFYILTWIKIFTSILIVFFAIHCLAIIFNEKYGICTFGIKMGKPKFLEDIRDTIWKLLDTTKLFKIFQMPKDMYNHAFIFLFGLIFVIIYNAVFISRRRESDMCPQTNTENLTVTINRFTYGMALAYSVILFFYMLWLFSICIITSSNERQ